MEDSNQLVVKVGTSASQGSSSGQNKTRKTTAATDRPHLHDQSCKNHGDEASECIDHISEEVLNPSTSEDKPHGEKLSNGTLIVKYNSLKNRGFRIIT